jgi:hypothetical protein
MHETSITLTPHSKEHDASVGVRAKVSFTPSPNAVEDFRSTTITNSNVSDVVSDAIFGQLVVVTDDEVIEYASPIALPELTEAYYEQTIDSENDVVDEVEHDVAARYSLRHSANTPTVPLPQRMLRQAISSLASSVPTAEDTESIPQLHVGNERHVLFYTSSLGIRLNRGTDGYVRILSVSQLDNDEDRVGDIFDGDVVLEVNGVDLRHTPIDSSDWKMIIGLMKMSPRPMKIVVAEELLNVDSSSTATSSACGGTTLDTIHEQQSKDDNRRRSGATKAFMHFMKRPSASEMNVNDAKPTLEELAEDHLASIDLDHSQDALEDDRFEESMLTTTQMNNLL